jgi:hypothetical protein
MTAIGGSTFKDDRRPENNAVIAWINHHGGIAGRPAAAVYNNIDATADPATESEAACAQWTQDAHVSFAIPRSAVADNDLLRTCLGKAGVPSMVEQSSRTSEKDLASSPLWFEPESLSLEAYARNYVRGLAAQGFFKSGKVGVVYYDKKAFPTVLKSVLLPELKAAGVPSAVTFAASIDSASTLSSGGSQMNNAVLSFRSQGVTKVLFFEPWAGYFVFLQDAQSQHYQPTYGLTSQQAPEAAIGLGLVHPSELTGARLVSWVPIGDVASYTGYTGPRWNLCSQIYKAAGIQLGPDQTSLDFQMVDCEYLLLIQDGYRNAPARLTSTVGLNGLAAIGAKLQLASRPRGSLSSSKHWGVSELWYGQFVAAKKSFVLEGPGHPVSG